MDGPGSLRIHDISENDLRQPDHKLAKPGVLFKQRHDIVVREVVTGIIVSPK